MKAHFEIIQELFQDLSNKVKASGFKEAEVEGLYHNYDEIQNTYVLEVETEYASFEIWINKNKETKEYSFDLFFLELNSIAMTQGKSLVSVIAREEKGIKNGIVVSSDKEEDLDYFLKIIHENLSQVMTQESLDEKGDIKSTIQDKEDS